MRATPSIRGGRWRNPLINFLISFKTKLKLLSKNSSCSSSPSKRLVGVVYLIKGHRLSIALESPLCILNHPCEPEINWGAFSILEGVVGGIHWII